MTRFLKTVALLLGVLTLGAFSTTPGPVAATAVSVSPSLASALQAGRPFVLVVSPARVDQATLESESYGD